MLGGDGPRSFYLVPFLCSGIKFLLFRSSVSLKLGFIEIRLYLFRTVDQITEFKDGGVAIGLSCPHMYADPTCATLLIKTWGDAHRRACIVHPPFFNPQALDIRPTVTSTSIIAQLESKSKHIIPPTTTKFSTTTFRFDEKTVSRCLDEIKAESPNATAFDAIVGLFWWRIGNVSSLNVGVDFRKSLYAPLPHGYFGNAIHFSEVSGGDGADWGKLTEAVRTHVAGLGEDDYLSTVEWLDSKRYFTIYHSPITIYYSIYL